jgi:hypothetical protein
VQEQAFLTVQLKPTKIAEALSLLCHAAILRTVRKIEPIPKDIEPPHRAGCKHGDPEGKQERA